MKKLMIAAAIVCAAACTQAETSWTFASVQNITGTDGTGFWTGTATITCEALGYTKNLPINAGYVSDFADISAGDPTKTYTFTLSMTDGNYTYSQTKSSQMNWSQWSQSWSAGHVTFAGGNAWTAAPEPTSGLLMLLGVAGLCLRRKQRG